MTFLHLLLTDRKGSPVIMPLHSIGQVMAEARPKCSTIWLNPMRTEYGDWWVAVKESVPQIQTMIQQLRSSSRGHPDLHDVGEYACLQITELDGLPVLVNLSKLGSVEEYQGVTRLYFEHHCVDAQETVLQIHGMIQQLKGEHQQRRAG